MHIAIYEQHASSSTNETIFCFSVFEFMAAMKTDSCKINASVTSDGSFSLDGFYPSEMREDFKK